MAADGSAGGTGEGRGAGHGGGGGSRADGGGGGGGSRRQRLVTALVWTVVATVLFLGFGYAAGRTVTRTLLAFGALEPETEPLLLEVLRCGAGVALLGVSAVYRRLAGAENAGSLAAWLAGWVLVVSQGALLVSRVSDRLAVGVLVAALVAWVAVQGSRRRRGLL